MCMHDCGSIMILYTLKCTGAQRPWQCLLPLRANVLDAAAPSLPVWTTAIPADQRCQLHPLAARLPRSTSHPQAAHPHPTPTLVSGSISRTGRSGDTMSGSEGPYTSASKMPTLAPICASVYARLTAVVDLPTPPLQLDTAMMWRTPDSPPGRPLPGVRGAVGCAVMVMPTSPTQGSACGGGVRWERR